jgi:hypothetical protein
LEYETERNDICVSVANGKCKKSLILRKSPISTKKPVPKIKGIAKSCGTKEGNTHENSLILAFGCTSPNTDRGWWDTSQPEMKWVPSPAWNHSLLRH